MDKRIQQFLSAENITQSQLADTLGVARASVSHILAGRNKPSFDFIERIASHYPSVNLDWLITGNGRMYKDSPAASSGHPSDLFEKTVGEPANTIGKPANTIGEPANTIREPANIIGEPANTVGEPANTIGKPANTIGVPANTAGKSVEMAIQESETPLFTIETPPATGQSKEYPIPAPAAIQPSVENSDYKQQSIENTRVISKIVIFYSDGTYKEVL